MSALGHVWTAPSWQGESSPHPGDLVGERDGRDLRWSPRQQRGEPRPMPGAMDFGIADHWLHRPSLRREDSPCQLGAVHTWPKADISALLNDVCFRV